MSSPLLADPLAWFTRTLPVRDAVARNNDLASFARHVQRDIVEAADGHAAEARRWRERDEEIEMAKEQLQAEAEDAMREFEEVDEADEMERLK